VRILARPGGEGVQADEMRPGAVLVERRQRRPDLVARRIAERVDHRFGRGDVAVAKRSDDGDQ
jgi:hypothetical protein